MAQGMQDEYGQTPRKGLVALLSGNGQAQVARPQQPGPSTLDPRDPGVIAAARELSAARAYLQKRQQAGY